MTTKETAITKTKPKKPKIPKEKVKNHFSDPLSTTLNRIGGKSRNAGDASEETKNIVLAEIQRAAKSYGLSLRDTANLIAFAQVESGFNPDAAARPIKKKGKQTSASGLFQIVDKTADDAIHRLIKNPWSLGIQLDQRKLFDYQSDIQYGIVVYLDKKRVAQGSEDVLDIYAVWHSEVYKDGKVRKGFERIIKQLEESSKTYLKYLEQGIPITIDKIVAFQAHRAPVIVTQESATGRNEQFLDVKTGQTMTRTEFVAAIQAGKYPDYRIAYIAGLATPVSKPDKLTENNLG